MTTERFTPLAKYRVEVTPEAWGWKRIPANELKIVQAMCALPAPYNRCFTLTPLPTPRGSSIRFKFAAQNEMPPNAVLYEIPSEGKYWAVCFNPRYAYSSRNLHISKVLYEGTFYFKTASDQWALETCQPELEPELAACINANIAVKELARLP